MPFIVIDTPEDKSYGEVPHFTRRAGHRVIAAAAFISSLITAIARIITAWQ